MAKGQNANRILGIILTVIFIVLLVVILFEIQKPHESFKYYQGTATSYLFFEDININQLVVLKSIIFSLTVLFPIFILAKLLIKGRIGETQNWFLIALLILLITGTYLTFLI